MLHAYSKGIIKTNCIMSFIHLCIKLVFITPSSNSASPIKEREYKRWLSLNSRLIYTIPTNHSTMTQT